MTAGADRDGTVTGPDDTLAGVNGGLDAVSAAPGTAVLQASDVNAWFGTQHVLKDVSLLAKKQAVTALIGPSGSGKSTLIRCLNRMHEEVRGARLTGRVLFDGRDMYAQGTDPVDVRRRIGMVFQRPTPFPTMSVMDNAVAGLRLGTRHSKAQLRERGEEALRKAGLWEEVKDRLSQPGGGLSGGQQQRLCIARALAVEPQVLLMDEPASALDPVSTQRIEQLIAELKGRYSVVIVTHNLQQALRVADDTMFMLDGQVIEAGPTGEIFGSPKDKRTEDYVLGRFG
ncbi:MAG TPA: phosphate ABC transporter ATP-binding protein PstB [Streptosporangiaceae bacterium]|jgi:phosphate transport system ATP-binding protein|nr:phosphate ABC transporter ATP-binding protein PstB [Streptosporangiaceae bacterium]